MLSQLPQPRELRRQSPSEFLAGGVVVLPGSSRSGENATITPPGIFGATSSVVVPGHVVLSSTTSCPARACGAIAATVPVTKLMSGSCASPSGVGTQMRIASHSRNAVKSLVATNPFVRAAAISSAAIRWM